MAEVSTDMFAGVHSVVLVPVARGSVVLFSLQQTDESMGGETGLNTSPVGVARETRAMPLCER